MANRRMINKDDYESIEFWNLTPRQQALYHALMLYADDDGIMSAWLVESKCFPYKRHITEDELLEDLVCLQTQGFIILYDSDQYLQVTNWWTKQFIDKKLYKPTHVKELPPNYCPRPDDLKKYDYSRKLLEQNRRGKNKLDKASIVENSTHDYDLPFK